MTPDNGERAGMETRTPSDDQGGEYPPNASNFRDARIKAKLDELSDLLRKQSPERVDLILSRLTDTDEPGVEHGNDDEAEHKKTGTPGNRTSQGDGEETANRADAD